MQLFISMQLLWKMCFPWDMSIFDAGGKNAHISWKKHFKQKSFRIEYLHSWILNTFYSIQCLRKSVVHEVWAFLSFGATTPWCQNSQPPLYANGKRCVENTEALMHLGTRLSGRQMRFMQINHASRHYQHSGIQCNIDSVHGHLTGHSSNLH